MSAIHSALRAYRAALLETAVADLAALKSGLPRDSALADRVVRTRAEVLSTARDLSAVQLTEALMAVNFLGESA